MTEAGGAGSEARSAGSMLRAARERQGLHIAALSAAIKVPQAKLEALEAGRYEELTDATFVRALAHSVCRVLKIDAKPVLELLPAVHGALLERVDHGLKAPFQERPGRQPPGEERLWHKPVFWLVLLLLVAAAGFLLWPQRSLVLPSLPSWSDLTGGDAARAPAAKAPVVAAPASLPAAAAVSPVAAASLPAAEPAAAAASGAIVETVHVAESGRAAADAAPAGIAVVRASEPSWVEARDARGTLLVSRTLQPGEAIGLDGPLPLRLVVGNATATEVMMRGKKVPLGAPNRDNVVRVELK